MKFLPVLLLVSVFFLAGCGDKQKNQPTTTNAPSSGSSALTAPVDYLDAIVRAKTTAEKTVDTVSLQNAIQMFSVEKGRYPKTLDELVTSKVIPSLPAAPYGMKLVYDANTGTVKVVKE
jgi:uncharacterized lipoprotein YehR (DUF1307 family)